MLNEVDEVKVSVRLERGYFKWLMLLPAFLGISWHAVKMPLTVPLNGLNPHCNFWLWEEMVEEIPSDNPLYDR